MLLTTATFCYKLGLRLFAGCNVTPFEEGAGLYLENSYLYCVESLVKKKKHIHQLSYANLQKLTGSQNPDFPSLKVYEANFVISKGKPPRLLPVKNWSSNSLIIKFENLEDEDIKVELFNHHRAFIYKQGSKAVALIKNNSKFAFSIQNKQTQQKQHFVAYWNMNVLNVFQVKEVINYDYILKGKMLLMVSTNVKTLNDELRTKEKNLMKEIGQLAERLN